MRLLNAKPVTSSLTKSFLRDDAGNKKTNIYVKDSLCMIGTSVVSKVDGAA